jgi:hypothetical protein
VQCSVTGIPNPLWLHRKSGTSDKMTNNKTIDPDSSLNDMIVILFGEKIYETGILFACHKLVSSQLHNVITVRLSATWTAVVVLLNATCLILTIYVFTATCYPQAAVWFLGWPSRLWTHESYSNGNASHYYEPIPAKAAHWDYSIGLNMKWIGSCGVWLYNR